MASANKYASVVTSLGRPLPSWVSDTYDQLRIAAYDGYDDMYKNVPGTFRVAMRGDDDKPVYIPSAAKIIEATNRYLGKGWNWAVISVNPDQQVAEAGRVEIELALGNLFTREELPTKFYSLKRDFLKRGDAFLHVTANLANAAGLRLSIREVSARSVFPIAHPTDEQTWVGVYITELMFADDGTTQIARRQEYRYNDDGTVFTQLTFWEPNAWDDRWIGHPPLKPVATPSTYATDPAMDDLLGGTSLPSSVRQIPLYHFRNRREGGEPFGTSQIAGVETLIAAINQNVSDEEITLAMQGLGVYITDSSRPVNENNEETDWVVAPGIVLEVKPGTKFDRLEGVKSVIPFQDHLAYIDKAMEESTGLSSTAVGNVDVQVAASGVALRLDMAPILAQNEEKEVELLSKMDQFMFDLLVMWLPVDGVSVPPGIKVVNSFSDPLPTDRAAVVAEVTALVTAQLMSRDFAIRYLTAKLGYQFPADMLLDIANEEDRVLARIAAEVSGAGVPTDAGDGAGDISQTPVVEPTGVA